MNARAPSRVLRPWTTGEVRLARSLAAHREITWKEIADRLAEVYAPPRTPDSIEAKLQKEFPRQSKRRWTKTEIAYLKSADRQRLSFVEVLRKLDRSADACLYQARRLKLSQTFIWKAEHLRPERGANCAWRPEEDALLLSDRPVSEIAAQLRRTPLGVVTRARRLLRQRSVLHPGEGHGHVRVVG